MPKNPSKIFVVVPAYNESKMISKVIGDLKSHGYHKIVVVDDGSKDNTASVSGKEGVVVLRHMINRGQGASLKTGIDYALKEGADIIVTFDSDGQHHAEDISRLVKPIQAGEVGACLGSRFMDKKSNVSFVRKIFLKGGAFIIWVMYGIKLSDSHNGLRALSRKAAQVIEIKSDKMEHASEILEQISKNKIKYKEIPVTITYTDYSRLKGQSTFNSIKILSKMIFRKLFK